MSLAFLGVRRLARSSSLDQKRRDPPRPMGAIGSAAAVKRHKVAALWPESSQLTSQYTAATSFGGGDGELPAGLRSLPNVTVYGSLPRAADFRRFCGSHGGLVIIPSMWPSYCL